MRCKNDEAMHRTSSGLLHKHAQQASSHYRLISAYRGGDGMSGTYTLTSFRCLPATLQAGSKHVLTSCQFEGGITQCSQELEVKTHALGRRFVAHLRCHLSCVLERKVLQFLPQINIHHPLWQVSIIKITSDTVMFTQVCLLYIAWFVWVIQFEADNACCHLFPYLLVMLRVTNNKIGILHTGLSAKCDFIRSHSSQCCCFQCHT